MIKYFIINNVKGMHIELKLPVKIILVTIITLLSIALLFYTVVGIILLGPSKDASRIWIEKFYESDKTKFIPSLYLSDDRISAILNSEEIGESFDTHTVVYDFSEDK